jgi:hypothetical protein
VSSHDEWHLFWPPQARNDRYERRPWAQIGRIAQREEQRGFVVNTQQHARDGLHV